MKPEGKVKARIREIFARHGVEYTHVPASQFGKAGVGDYICCVNGIYLEVEAKAGKGPLSELQKIRRDNIKNANGLYIKVNERNLAKLEALIMILKKQKSIRAVLFS